MSESAPHDRPASFFEGIVPMMRTDDSLCYVTFGPCVQWVYLQVPDTKTTTGADYLAPALPPDAAANKKAIRAANRIVGRAAQRIEQEIAADYRFVGQEIDAVLPQVNMQNPEQVQLPPEAGTNLL